MDEDFIEDCRQAGKEEAAERGRLPYYQRRYSQRPKCRACGFEPYDALTEDGLCRECDAAVLKMEEGRIP
jgi:hypothetical protein